MQTNTLQNEELKEQIVDSSHVLSQNHTNEQNHTIHSHITLFREIFCVDERINDSILEKQKRYFGFTLFILHTKTLYDALVLGVENGMREKKAKNHWIQYYLNSIFGQLFKGVMIIVLLIFIIISPSFWVIWLLPAVYFTYLLVFHFFPHSLFIHEKVMLLKKTQIFFNITIQEAEEMKNFFIKTKKRSYFSELFSLYKKNVNGAVLSAKIAFFLFISLVSFIVILLRQAFFEKWFVLSDLFLFFLLFFAIFSEKIGNFLIIKSYQVYFWTLDNLPSFYSHEDQIRDYFLDIYMGGSSLISSVERIEWTIQSLKDGTIDPKMWKQLTTVLGQITSLWNIVEERKHFLKGKAQFQEFLIHLFNDIIQKYANSFDFLQERIYSIEKGITFENLSPEEAKILEDSIQPILEKNKNQLEELKKMILSKRIQVLKQ